LLAAFLVMARSWSNVAPLANRTLPKEVANAALVLDLGPQKGEDPRTKTARYKGKNYQSKIRIR
jgi:hypothetical protein